MKSSTNSQRNTIVLRLRFCSNGILSKVSDARVCGTCESIDNALLGDIVVTTSSKRERLEDFLRTFDDNFQLTDGDIQAIDDAGAKLHFRKYWTSEIDGQKTDL